MVVFPVRVIRGPVFLDLVFLMAAIRDKKLIKTAIIGDCGFYSWKLV
jgi:hypothetical protein